MGLGAFIVLRGDLRMSAGKAMAQVGHGVDAIHLAASGADAGLLIRLGAAVPAWRASGRYGEWVGAGDRKKVVLASPSLPALEALQETLERRGVAFCVIMDAGHTELPPGTVTGLVILPTERDDLPGVVRHMALWR